MLRVVIIILLCVGGDWAVAQDDDDQKNQSEEQTRRPSWSSGLPERQKTETMVRPNLSQDFKDDLTIDRSELGLERPTVDIPATVTEQEQKQEQEQEPQQETVAPAASIEEPVSDSQLVPAEAQDVAAEPESLPELQPEPEALPEQPVIEPAIYEWQVIEEADVDFPLRGIRNQVNGWVDVEVTLNPQGDVVSVQTVDYSDEAAIYVEAAEDSLRQWIFQPPQEQGVTELVSKVYRIDFVPPIIEQPTPPQITETETTEAAVAEPEIVAEDTTEQGATEVAVNEPAVDDDIPLQGDAETEFASEQYQWQVLNQAPLEYPITAARNRLEGWVDIMVTINPDGEVIALEEEKYSSRGRIFVNPAKESLQKWQFEPPKNQGITNNLSRSYRIEFEL
ncbi:MAG: TonB family protein [Proteobacteria bacterium]|nr:MAG: TonB family protein [Pseudomonadota bacterium]